MNNQLGSPSIQFLIEPNGEVQLIGSVDKFSAREYVNAGCFFPQQSLPNMNMMTISKAIGEVLYEKGIMGHVTVDLVSFPDPTSPTSHPLFWAIDLNCGMTDYASSCLFFDFLMVRICYLKNQLGRETRLVHRQVLYRKRDWGRIIPRIPDEF
jgi:hypothetical protein